MTPCPFRLRIDRPAFRQALAAPAAQNRDFEIAGLFYDHPLPSERDDITFVLEIRILGAKREELQQSFILPSSRFEFCFPSARSHLIPRWRNEQNLFRVGSTIFCGIGSFAESADRIPLIGISSRFHHFRDPEETKPRINVHKIARGLCSAFFQFSCGLRHGGYLLSLFVEIWMCEKRQ